ncbi:MAG TPA: class I adenylate-forming enzyme family protein [Propionibacteriaceae bacterium]|nr:class I adenylate-forming enzyme family protein [Propionibacteriaceae bacterium]
MDDQYGATNGQSITDRLLASGADDAPAIVDGGRVVTYGQLRTDVRRLLAELDARGVAPGARVAILGANSSFWVAAYLAALHRYVAVPLSTNQPAPELARLADWVDCAAVLIDRRHEKVFAAGFGDRPLITEATLARDPLPEWPRPVVAPDSDAALMFTSGTTARPKAVRTTHRNLLANTESIVEYLGLRADDRMLVVLPFFYCFGASLLHTHLLVGGSVVLCNTFAFPETALELIEREQCTGLAGVPSTYQLLLRASGFRTRRLPSLRHLQQAGGKLPPVLIEELVAAQPQARVFVMYGQTEATARLSYLPPELQGTKLGSIGRGIPGVELRVVDEHGEPVRPGVTGEIVAAGDNISPGYLDDPEATREKFAGGVLHTGDLAVVDEDGFIFVVDRLADFIKTWGHRVSSQEIEDAALRLPDLVSAAAIGVPDAEAGEAVVLVAVLRPGAQLTEAEIAAHLREMLAKHMVPRTIRLVDALPLNDNGKVAKGRLRSMFTDGGSE